MNKSLIYVGATIGGTVGGLLGSMIDHSALGLWSILFSLIGGLGGIYLAYKIQQ